MSPGASWKAARQQRLDGRPAEALALLAPGLADPAPGAETLFEAARCQHALGDDAAARALLDRLLAAQPDHKPGLLMRLNLLAAGTDIPAALRCAIGTIRRLPEEARPRLIRARLLRQAGRVEKARDALLALARLAPDDPARLLELARCQHALGAHAAALDSLRAAGQLRREALALGVNCALALRDDDALRRHADWLAAQLAATTGPDRHAPVAQALARLLCQMEAGPQDVTWAGWLDRLGELAGSLPPPLLWRLARAAEAQGGAARAQPLLEALLDGRELSLPLARDVLRAAHAAGGGALELAAPRLRAGLPPAAQAGFDLAHAALRDGAAGALAARQRVPARGPQEVLWVRALLLEAGQRGRALRYLRRACRAHPEDASLRGAWVKDLIAAGEVAAARAEVARLLRLPDQLAGRAPRIAAQACLALDDAAGALRHLEDDRDPPAGMRFQALLRLGRLEEAEAALASPASRVPQRRRVHRNATLDGLRLAEYRLATEAEGASGAAQFAGAAIRVLDDWLAAPRPALTLGPIGAGQPPIPRTILQYWNTGQPPAALRPLMDSWRREAGFAYRLLDRDGARQFLLAELGAEWAAALRLARHPAEESDYVRLCHLLVHGGVYADCDDRLVGPLATLAEGRGGLVVFREPGGALANNLLLASPRNPILAQAAIAARRALLRRDNDSPWGKTGPGLLTRMVASAIEEARRMGGPPPVEILPQHVARRVVQIHVPLAYKRTGAYWNSASRPPAPAGLEQALRRAAAG